MQFVWRGQHKERGRTKVFTFLEYHAWPSASYLLTQCKVGPFIYFLTEIMETFLPLNLIHTFRNYFERSLLQGSDAIFYFVSFYSFVSSISSNLTQNIFSSAPALTPNLSRFFSPLATVLHTKRHQRGNNKFSIISRKERRRYSGWRRVLTTW